MITDDTKEYHRGVAHNILKRRVALDGFVSQQELSRRAGLGERSVGVIEVKKRGINVDTLVRIAKALGCQPRDLLPLL